MPHREETPLPQGSQPPSRNARLLWFAGLFMGVAAGAMVAFELASIGGR
jgi:hypothetical protein